jgi:hypothetical protein
MNVKRILLPVVFTVSIVSLWSLVGCSKHSSSSTTTDGTMTATVNGGTYNAVSYVVAGYLSAYGQLIVQGDSIRGTDTTEIQVAMPYIPTVNVPITTDSSQYVGLSYKMPGKEYDAYFDLTNSHGSITLSGEDTVNHRVAGTFSGVLYNIVNSNDSLVIINGAFSSTYSVQ